MSDTQIPGSDLTINCSDGKLYYTRYLLQRIPYYDAMLNSGFKESTSNEINFKYSIEIFKLLADFIETKKLVDITHDEIYIIYKLSIFLNYSLMYDEILKFDKYEFKVYYKAVLLDDVKILETFKKVHSRSYDTETKKRIVKKINKFYKFIITSYANYLYIFDGIIEDYVTSEMFELALEHNHDYISMQYIKSQRSQSKSNSKHKFMTGKPVKTVKFVVQIDKNLYSKVEPLQVLFIWLQYNPNSENIALSYIVDNHNMFMNSSPSNLYKLMLRFQDDYEKIKQILLLKLHGGSK